jgi:putative tricarboxylic transport membrane protein
VSDALARTRSRELRLLAIPDRLLYPSILLMACIGVYSVNHSTFDLMLAAAFGLVGFIMIRLDLDRTSFLLGFILGPLLEENLRRALTFSGGDPTVFFRRPASLVILLIGGLLTVGGSPLAIRRLRRLTGATTIGPHSRACVRPEVRASETGSPSVTVAL